MRATVPTIREEIELGAKIVSALIGIPFVTPDTILSIIPTIATHKFVFKNDNKPLWESYGIISKIIDDVECPI